MHVMEPDVPCVSQLRIAGNLLGNDMLYMFAAYGYMRLKRRPGDGGPMVERQRGKRDK